ncbi:TPA: hypothetical protein DEP96_01885 [Candidatus Uhrbacteria bacterium]|nr:hypothetical protein [Candidatus Uhrbacteria bacterium]
MKGLRNPKVIRFSGSIADGSDFEKTSDYICRRKDGNRPLAVIGNLLSDRLAKPPVLDIPVEAVLVEVGGDTSLWGMTELHSFHQSLGLRNATASEMIDLLPIIDRAFGTDDEVEIMALTSRWHNLTAAPGGMSGGMVPWTPIVWLKQVVVTFGQWHGALNGWRHPRFALALPTSTPQPGCIIAEHRNHMSLFNYC